LKLTYFEEYDMFSYENIADIYGTDFLFLYTDWIILLLTIVILSDIIAITNRSIIRKK